MKQLVHKGVLVPKYESKKLSIYIKGVKVELTSEQEEMAVAWVKKLGTVYVEDKVFVNNFFIDFCKALNINERLGPEEYNFSMIHEYIEKEKTLKVSLSKEERKRLAEQRKAIREANRKKYGYAIIDGVKTEISNYIAEPSCIFMGRGKHPLRGRWKDGPSEEDIELNLSPDACKPQGNWKAVIWQSDAMWIARWKDKLSNEIKYVWLSDNSLIKQEKDIEKFNKAKELQQNLTKIQKHIYENLDAEDLKRRKTATVCFLVDKLKIRVGDERDPDEADTVGASTLRSEHIRFNSDDYVTFNFLGKDSVPHFFKVKLPKKVTRNLKEFSANTKSLLFDGVDSNRVSEFLDKVISGLSAKVFRTYYASEAVGKKLENTFVKTEAPEYVKKYVATIANLEAAKICNHRRTISKTWESTLQKKETHLRDSTKKAKETLEKLKQKIEEKEEWYTEKLRKQEERLKVMKEKLETGCQPMTERKQHRKPVESLKRRINLQQKIIIRQEQSLRNTRDKYTKQIKKMEERLKKQKQSNNMMLERMKLKIKAEKETRDYNLNTSLKSYIDPRKYYNWGKEVNYDWKLYYPKTLQKKFLWVETTLERNPGAT